MPETARDNIFNPYNSCGIDSSKHQPSNKCSYNNNNNNNENALNNNNLDESTTTLDEDDDHIDVVDDVDDVFQPAVSNKNNNSHHAQAIVNDNNNNTVLNTCHASACTSTSITTTTTSCNSNSTTSTPTNLTQSSNMRSKRHHCVSSNTLDNDLEILDRELNAINASPLLIDPEITQGAEQLEKALLSSSRKRARAEDESDRLVREALSQFYIPPQRFISAIEDCPLDLVSGGNALNMGAGLMRHEWHMGGLGVSSTPNKRSKLDYEANISYNNNNTVGISDLELDFDMNPNQKDFEVIMDALRLGTPSPTPTNDSCGQAAMMLSESASVFHNLVVTSLET